MAYPRVRQIGHHCTLEESKMLLYEGTGRRLVKSPKQG